MEKSFDPTDLCCGQIVAVAKWNGVIPTTSDDLEKSKHLLSPKIDMFKIIAKIYGDGAVLYMGVPPWDTQCNLSFEAQLTCASVIDPSDIAAVYSSEDEDAKEALAEIIESALLDKVQELRTTVDAFIAKCIDNIPMEIQHSILTKKDAQKPPVNIVYTADTSDASM